MQFYFFLILNLFIISKGYSQQLSAEDQQEIFETMQQQEKCWNEGDVECFMEGYWKSDSLKFIGSKGLTYGWQKTLDNYKEAYPDRSAMGKLAFENLSIEALGDNYVLLIGKWKITRENDTIGGHYSLTWKKMNGKWVIIADHSS